eukprot:669841-Rhodomonas_salina.1
MVLKGGRPPSSGGAARNPQAEPLQCDVLPFAHKSDSVDTRGPLPQRLSIRSVVRSGPSPCGWWRETDGVIVCPTS